MLAPHRSRHYESVLIRIARPLTYVRYCSLALAGAIIGIIPILLVIFVIVEFQALDDMIAESDTDIGVRLYVARR